jgi:Uma2 family endonuclease
MRAKAEATIEDLLHMAGKAELVDGEIVPMSPTGWLPGYSSYRITRSLDDYAERTGRGQTVPDNVAFVVSTPRKRTFSPDAAYYKGEVGAGFIEGAPLFAVEVRSEGDYGPAAEREIAAKRTAYFASGTQVVWDVDVLREEVVRVYRISDPDHATIYRRGEIAEAEPAVPEWTLAVDSISPRPRSQP